MEQLSHRDVLALSQTMREIYACIDVEDIPAHFLLILQKIIPFEFASYDEINLQAQAGMYALAPSELLTPKNTETFERHMHEHPFLIYFIKTHARTDAPQPVKLSDLISKACFHRTGLYNEFYRPWGIENQIGIELIKAPALSSGIALKRCRTDFSERERLLFSLLRPHLIQAYQNAKRFRAMREGVCTCAVGAMDSGLIPLDGSHEPLEDRIAALFGPYFEKGSEKGNSDLGALRAWIRHVPPGPFSDGPPNPQRPLVIEQNGKRLILRLIADGLKNRRFLAFEEHHVETAQADLKSLGLTRRETEVLSWIAQDKSNPETAVILGIRPRTVEKHLERIYTKLGVENRTAAAARARGILGNGRD